MRRLELGSGLNPFRPDDPTWEHADLNSAAPSLDHLLDFSKPLPFDDATFDELRAVDVLEHCSYRRTDAVLAEWARVLKPGGRIFCQVPDADGIMRRYVARDHEGLRTPSDLPDTLMAGACWRLLGGLDDGRYAGDPMLNVHMSLWSDFSLSDALERAGFEVESMVTNAHPNIQAIATKREEAVGR